MDFSNVFNKKEIIYIQNKFPLLFQKAEAECTRGGKIGMEVGIIREQIISSFLRKKFGEKNVNTDIPTTEKVTDVYIKNEPVSIKSFTGKKYSANIKIFWMVTGLLSEHFMTTYRPSSDLIIVHVNWRAIGYFHFIPFKTQTDIFNKIGVENYLKLPNNLSNERGVILSKTAYELLTQDKSTFTIPILWNKQLIYINPIERWIKEFNDYETSC